MGDGEKRNTNNKEGRGVCVWKVCGLCFPLGTGADVLLPCRVIVVPSYREVPISSRL